MVRFKNRYFVVEIIWGEALRAPCARPPHEITRAALQKALQVPRVKLGESPRGRACDSRCLFLMCGLYATTDSQDSVSRNFGDVGAGSLFSGMTVKYYNPIAAIFIASMKSLQYEICLRESPGAVFCGPRPFVPDMAKRASTHNPTMAGVSREWHTTFWSAVTFIRQVLPVDGCTCSRQRLLQLILAEGMLV
jgi:hypothetical protein